MATTNRPEIQLYQIYPRTGIVFRISHHLMKQIKEEINLGGIRWLSEGRYTGFRITIIVSAVSGSEIDGVAIKGPTVLEKKKVVEYVVNLPYDRIRAADNKLRIFLTLLFQGINEIGRLLNAEFIFCLDVPTAVDRIESVAKTDPRFRFQSADPTTTGGTIIW